MSCRVIIAIVDNGMYGTIRMHQERDYPGRVVATALKNPDFAAYARAFGGFGVTVEKTADFAAGLRGGARLRQAGDHPPEGRSRGDHALDHAQSHPRKGAGGGGAINASLPLLPLVGRVAASEARAGEGCERSIDADPLTRLRLLTYRSQLATLSHQGRREMSVQRRSRPHCIPPMNHASFLACPTGAPTTSPASLRRAMPPSCKPRVTPRRKAAWRPCRSRRSRSARASPPAPSIATSPPRPSSLARSLPRSPSARSANCGAPPRPRPGRSRRLPP